MHLKKLVIEEVDLDHKHLLLKNFIREAIESQQGPPNLKSSFLDLGQMEEEMKDEGFSALIRTKRPVQLMGVLLQGQQKRIQETFEEEEDEFLDWISQVMEEENCRTHGLKQKHTSNGESTIKAILTTSTLMEGGTTVGMEAHEDASRKEEIWWQEIRREFQVSPKLDMQKVDESWELLSDL